MPQGQFTMKILINPKPNLKIIHTYGHRGTNEYQSLIAKGYIEIGTIKTNDEEPRVYWNSDYFDVEDKYQRKLGQRNGY